MSNAARQMHIGIYVQVPGSHVAGWRHPEAEIGGQNFELLRKIAATAERGCLDFIFFADSYSARVESHPSMSARFEPLTLLSALAMTTSRVGLAATVSTTYGQPFHVARSFASIDHLSGGRAAWNVVTGSVAVDAANFGVAEHPEHDHRYEIAEEFVDVVKGLWDCWDDDALVMDKASGVFIAPDRLRALNHKGRFFSVRGPLNISRSPQGQPVIIQAGSSGPGQNLAARTADVAFTSQPDLAAARTFYSGFKSRVAAFGRDPDGVALLPGLAPFVGRTRQEARDSLAKIQEKIDPQQAFSLLAHRLGHDVSGYPLDGPVPDLPPSDGLRYSAETLVALARRDNLTLRDLYHIVSSGIGNDVVCGAPADIADRMEEWFVERGADGFVLMPPWYPKPFEDFVTLVIPELQRRGLFRKAYSGQTLRDHLGVPRPSPRR